MAYLPSWLAIVHLRPGRQYLLALSCQLQNQF